MTPVTINVLGNDQDPDGDTLSIVSATSPSNGTAVIAGNGITYTPAEGFVGSDSFNYTINDGAGNEASAQVTVNVTEKVEPPVTPSGLTVSDNGSGGASVSWSDTPNETSYEVQRETWKAKGRGSWISTTTLSRGQDITQLEDSTGNGLFRYRIRSINTIGASSWSGWVEQTINSGQGGGGGNGKGKNR